MKRQLAVLSACVLVVVACSDGSSDSTSPSAADRLRPSALEQTIADRVATCIDRGSTRTSCECRANTTARFLSLSDFAEETRLLQIGDPSAIDKFQRRMFTEHRETMFKLGQALSNCPVMHIETE